MNKAANNADQFNDCNNCGREITVEDCNELPHEFAVNGTWIGYVCPHCGYDYKEFKK